MPLARKCVRCGHTFLAKKDEQYCAQCAKDELMAILKKDKEPTHAKDELPKEKVKEKVMTKCKNCGKIFEQTGKGRPAVNCPTCRELLNKPKKKDAEVTDEVITIQEEERDIPIITKEEVIEVKVTADDIKELALATDQEQEKNMVNHPTHYNKGKIEVIDFIEDQGLSFHLGNVIKYIARAGAKGDKLEDLKKAQWYLDRYINEVMK